MINQLFTTLNNGIKMPLLGLGVYDLYGKQAEQAVSDALEIGYRLVDTAAMYGNEHEIGNAIKDSNIPRSEIFVTTKVADSAQGYEPTLKAFDNSLEKLQMDYVDLYLIHWPVKAKRKDTWLALEKLYADKRVRAIGVANYLVPFLEEMKSYQSVIPAVDQVEFTPWLFRKDLIVYCQRKQIQLQSYSPITRGKKLDDKRLPKLCKKYNKTPAQVVLRWNIDHGISTIPKSSHKKRLQENFDITDFSLSAEEVLYMDGFHENFRICPDPMELL